MKYIKALISIIILVAIDQFTKWLSVKYLLPGGPIPVIKNIFELQYLENKGAAFGIFQNQKWFFIIMTIIIVIAISLLYTKLPETGKMRPLRIISIAIVSGAIGNFIDRIANGYVVDFLYFKLIDFPIFNVADIYVTVSAFVFLALVLFYYKDEDFSFFSKR